MGSGYFDTVSYSARAAARTATGTSLFTHSGLDTNMDVRNKLHRESRDNADSPLSFPIAVMFDVTGSMRDIPNYLQKELGKLMGFILKEDVVANPQLCFGAVGDAFSDAAPLQMGEFEADDALVEKCLSRVYLEGGGGGTHEESYELALYFFARHVQSDAWEKRGTKGALFLIGDENFYKTISRDAVKQWLGEDIGQDIATAWVAEELQRRWNVFLIRPGGTYHFDDKSIEQSWRELLPAQHVIRAAQREQIVPTLAMTIGALAGRTVTDSAAALKKHGFDKRRIDAALGALGTIAPGTLAPVAASALVATEGGSKAVRL